MGLLAFLGALGAGLIGFALFSRSRAYAAQAPGASHSTSEWPGPGPEISVAPPPIFVPPTLPEVSVPAPRSPQPAPPSVESASSPSTSPVRPPTSTRLEALALLLAPGCLARGIQLAYAVQWVALESGGNPCAVGYPPSKGPDGYPREMGIAQFYNPDDLERLGLSGEELRAYCVPGDQHEVMFRGRRVRGFSQDLARPLTSEEMTRQANAAVGLIARSMTRVTEVLDSIGASTLGAWSPTRRDFWRLVKLQHGLPALISEGLVRINAKLGRPPRDWEEFKRGLDAVTLGKNAEEKRRQGLFPSALANAERCASAFEERTVA